MEKTSKISVLLIIGLSSILPLWAYDFEANGLYYNRIDTDKVEVTYKTSDRNSYSGNIILPERVTYQGKEYYVTRIGDHAFMDCNMLSSIVIPDGITSIGNSAFAACEKLTSIVIPNSVSYIEKFAFVSCEYLVSIILPKSLKSIEDATFAGCSALASLSLPDSLVNIGNVVFVNCSSLTSIDIPKGVTDLKNCAIFIGCKNLKQITVAWETPPLANLLAERDFDLSQCTLIVPQGTKAQYMAADNWKDFGTIKEYSL